MSAARLITGTLLGLLAALQLRAAAECSVQYSVIDLGGLPNGDDYSYALGMNELGQVVGYSGAGTGERAFIWTPPTGMQDLGDLPGGDDGSIAYGINNLGSVVGWSNVSGERHAFLWENGVKTDLGTFDGGYDFAATDINDAGEIIGTYWTCCGYRAFFWQQGVFQQLSQLADHTTGPVRISQAGHIAGWSNPAPSFRRAVAWLDGPEGSPTELNSSGEQGVAQSINDLNQVVGNVVGPSTREAFLWQNGVISRLGTLGSDYSTAVAINNRQLIVGEFLGGYPNNRAFVWTFGVGMRDLNLLLDGSGIGWTLASARDINDQGQIVGYGVHNGVPRAFLLISINDCDGDGTADGCEPDCQSNGFPDDCDIAGGTSLDCNTNSTPDECELTGNDCNANGTPDDCERGATATACQILLPMNRKLHAGIPRDIRIIPSGSVCDDATSEPRQGGLTELRIGFTQPPGGPGPCPVTIAELRCPACPCTACPWSPYIGASTMAASIEGSDLVLTFSPGLENARSYKFEIGPSVTTIAGQSLEVRVLKGDVTHDGRVDGTDRSVVVGVWTGAGFSTNTDLNLDGATNATDRSIVVGAWTGTENCAP